jgi:glycosyltransferase involved in cell wall biosynthesis
MKYSSSPVVVEATEIQDFRFLESLNSNLIPVSFGASDWVDFRIFNPVESAKKAYDSIYVTSYHPIKRHHVFFKALSEIGDPTYRAALVFGQSGDAKKEIGQLIDYYNIRNNVTIYERVSQQQLNTILSEAKVNVLLSLKEGSNRSIFEALFTNVPGIVLKNNLGVNKSYINEMTGRLINESELAQVLQEFRTTWMKYSPREWALKNISPLITTRKLSETLQRCAREKGELWSKDIVPKVNAPEVEYFYSENAGSMLNSRKVIEIFLNKRHRSTLNDHELHQHLRVAVPSNQSGQAVTSPPKTIGRIKLE